MEQAKGVFEKYGVYLGIVGVAIAIILVLYVLWKAAQEVKAEAITQ